MELGEAQFIVPDPTGFFLYGTYDAVKRIEDLGFKSHGAYWRAFALRLAEYLRAGYILPEDAQAMLRRAALCPPLTFTETYRDHYNEFKAMGPCGG
jgi:hypothetical protein